MPQDSEPDFFRLLVLLIKFQMSQIFAENVKRLDDILH
jgi:hypothetical protein